MMIDDTYALAIYTSWGASFKHKQCGFLCLFVCLFVWSLVCLCALLFSFVCVLVSLFYDDRWYLRISNLYIAGSVVKTKTMWFSLFVRLFICVVACLFVCLTFFLCLFFSFFVLWWSMIHKSPTNLTNMAKCVQEVQWLLVVMCST